jgi:hypothetical protein
MTAPVNPDRLRIDIELGDRYIEFDGVDGAKSWKI